MLPTMIEIFLIKIGYKSGNSHEMWFRKFDLIYDGEGNIKKVSWEPSPHDESQVLFIGLNNIESAFVIDSKKVKEK